VIESVLFETDRPEIILARDILGAQYLGVLVSANEEGDRFLATGITSPRLGEFRAGRVDLRTIFVQSETSEILYGGLALGASVPTLSLEVAVDPPPEWLPSAGFFLTTFKEGASDDSVIARSAAMHRAVVVCSLTPPEAIANNRIDAFRLAVALRVFQSLVRHSYAKARATTPNWAAAFPSEDAPTMQVLAFSPGSFEIHMCSKTTADIAGTSPVGRALERVDQLSELAAFTGGAESEILEVARQHRGHAIAAFESLLQFISEEKTPFEYRWADPSMSTPHGKRIEPDDAGRLWRFLTSRQELSSEEVVLEGRFNRVDAKRGQWTVFTEEHEYVGRLDEGSDDLLDGVTVTTKRYRLTCTERLEESAGSGKQTSRLFLRKINEI
jgi:hypothetical protein